MTDPSTRKSNPRSIATFINDYASGLKGQKTIKSIAEGLKTYLTDIYRPEEQLKKIEKEIEERIKRMKGEIESSERGEDKEKIVVSFKDSDGKLQKAIGAVTPISLIVAGYDRGKDGEKKMSVYVIYIPGKLVNKRKHDNVNQYGADWTGQKDVVARVILGRDPRTPALGFAQEAINRLGEKKVLDELRRLEYRINWGGMTLFDAVDFATLMIEITAAIQRFSDGIQLTPGDLPGVGGGADVAIVTPDSGFHWHKRKELKLEKP
ncbi:hypothetical protein ACFL0Y_00965 [Patescibacteria group bacterium]